MLYRINRQKTPTSGLYVNAEGNKTVLPARHLTHVTGLYVQQWNTTERFVSSERKVPGVECQLQYKQADVCVYVQTYTVMPQGKAYTT